MINNTLLICTFVISVSFPMAALGENSIHNKAHTGDIASVKNVIKHAARTEIEAKDRLTVYEKAKKEGKTKIISYMQSNAVKRKQYDYSAKTSYSKNDVKAFVYNWFAGLDRQADIGVFKRHLNPNKVDMLFPDFPIKTISDFDRWYSNVIDNIQWNAHTISNLKVSGDEKNGFSVSLDVNWKAKTYTGKTYDMNTNQDWIVKVDKSRRFIIEKHRAKAIAKL